MRSARLMAVPMEDGGAREIAQRSRGTPRIANHLLRWVRDFAQVKAQSIVTQAVASQALTMRDIDETGLDEMDKRFLEALIHKFDGGPVGMSSLGVAIGEDASTLEDVHEPYLGHAGLRETHPKRSCGDACRLSEARPRAATERTKRTFLKPTGLSCGVDSALQSDADLPHSAHQPPNIMKMKLPTLAAIALSFAGLTGINQAQETPAVSDAKPVKVTIETSKGNIELELDAAKAPTTVANFVSYVKKGHYDGLIFHRVIPGFMIQGGGFTPDMQQKAVDRTDQDRVQKWSQERSRHHRHGTHQ